MQCIHSRMIKKPQAKPNNESEIFPRFNSKFLQLINEPTRHDVPTSIFVPLLDLFYFTSDNH